MTVYSIPDIYAVLARHGATGELARAMCAAILAESGGDSQAYGDWDPAYGYHSIGWYQMYAPGGLGDGLSVQQREDVDFATQFMLPVFQAALARGKQLGLGNVDLGVYACLQAERPEGYTDPNGAAAQRYQAAWLRAEPSPERTRPKALLARVTADLGLRLREQPTTRSRVLATLAGDRTIQLEPAARADGWTWYRVSTPAGIGYVAGEYLEPLPVSVPEE